MGHSLFLFLFFLFREDEEGKNVISQMGLSLKIKKNEMWNGGKASANKTSLFIYLELVYWLDYQMTPFF